MSIVNKIHVWWLTRQEEKIAFYLINIPAQIVLLILPGALLGTFGDSWWEADPSLFNMMVIPSVFMWIGLMFVVRWVISTLIILHYADSEEITLKIK